MKSARPLRRTPASEIAKLARPRTEHMTEDQGAEGWHGRRRHACSCEALLCAWPSTSESSACLWCPSAGRRHQAAGLDPHGTSCQIFKIYCRWASDVLHFQGGLLFKRTSKRVPFTHLVSCIRTKYCPPPAPQALAQIFECT